MVGRVKMGIAFVAEPVCGTIQAPVGGATHANTVTVIPDITLITADGFFSKVYFLLAVTTWEY